MDVLVILMILISGSDDAFNVDIDSSLNDDENINYQSGLWPVGTESLV